MWEVVKEGRLGNLETPPSVRKLQTALHAKAKAEPEYRFYLLYDKVYRADILSFAYARCKANGGAAGVDGQTFEDIEAYGSQDRDSEDRKNPDIETDWNPWLGELAQELREKTYRPQAVRRVYIPKPNSKKMRPLGIATIRDRVVQTAAMLVLEPIFEADLQPEQYAYRAGMNALDAVRTVHRLINTGHTAVVDADLRGYFDEIPHGPLMKSVARRITDRQVLHLIKMWIEAPVEETDDRGRKHRTTRNRDEIDFHDLKGDLDSLAALSGSKPDYRPSQAPWGHPGRSADVFRDGIHIGWIGQLHPRLQRALDLDRSVIAFEVDLGALQHRALPRASALSKFPSVRRDLAFVVADEVSWSAFADTVRGAAGASLRSLQLFDRYVGKGVESGFKSLAMGLILQDDSRTLTDRDVDAVVAEVTAALESTHAARIRE
jgi:hypothetical protein